LGPLSLVLIGPRANQLGGKSGWSPGYFNLQNLELRNGYSGDPGAPANTYTASDGTTQTYTTGCGIYIENGDHITIAGCNVHDNNEGIFGAGQGDGRNLEEVTIHGSYLHGNGTVTSYYDHNIYLEGINTIYEYNQFG